MRFSKKMFSALIAGLIFLAGCSNGEEAVYTNAEGSTLIMPMTEDADGNTVPAVSIVNDAEGSPILLTDENLNLLQVLTNSAGDPVTDENGGYLVSETVPGESTEDALLPMPDMKIGFIYSGPVQGSSHNQIFEIARDLLERALGIETCYVDQVLVQQFDEAVELLRKEGCGIIVSTSNHFVAACNVAATNEPLDMKYISFGGSFSGGTQAGFQPALYEAANVCGLAAAYNTETDKIGMVVDNNAFHAAGIASAFSLGVKELPATRIDVALNWALSDSYAETQAAIDDLIDKGCDIIFLYQTTDFGITYCESKGVTCIGYAYNLPELAPTTYLTGFYLNANNYLLDRIGRAINRNFSGDYINGGLSSGIVNLIELNTENAKDNSKEITDVLIEYILTESSGVFNGRIIDTNGNVRVENGARLPKDKIFAVDWLDNGIRTVTNMSDPKSDDDVVFSTLVVKQ